MLNITTIQHPENKKCRDCINFDRCEVLFKCLPQNTTCDFIPSKFLSITLTGCEVNGNRN